MTGGRDGQDGFSLVHVDAQQLEVLNLVRLCDIFRRAGRAAFEEPELAEIFNSKAVSFSGTLAEFQRGAKGAAKDFGRMLTQITLLARDHDIRSIVLPVAGDTDAGRYLREHIMDGENFSRYYNVEIAFQDEAYAASEEVIALGEPRVDGGPDIFNFGLFRS